MLGLTGEVSRGSYAMSLFTNVLRSPWYNRTALRLP